MTFQFDDFAAFIHMDGYATFVWLSFFGSLACFLYLIVAARIERKRLVIGIKQLQKRNKSQAARGAQSASSGQDTSPQNINLESS